MTEPQAPRRSTVLAVVLAVVFLAILGTAVGIILGTRSRQPGPGVATDQTTASPTVAPSPPQTSDAGNTQPSSVGTRTSPPTKTYPPPTKDTCPAYTVDAANRTGGKPDYR